MEKNSSTRSTKRDSHNVMKTQNGNFIFCNKSQSYEDQDYMMMNGFTWPPRSYNCSFCKREFRSAQALGGHMNVHRKDRARLRQSPPSRDDHGLYDSTILNLNLNSNPNPKFSSSSSLSTKVPPFCSRLSSSSPSLASLSEKKKWNSDLEYESVFDRLNTKRSDSACVEGKDVFKNLKKAESVKLDLEIGLLGDSKMDLDLELRLGY
ncbi:hypothetical protein UlMin_009889 [Ulmus minor]